MLLSVDQPSSSRSGTLLTEMKPFGWGQTAGIANGRPGEKLVRPGIFVRLDRTRQMLGRRSGIRGGFAAKK